MLQDSDVLTAYTNSLSRLNNSLNQIKACKKEEQSGDAYRGAALYYRCLAITDLMLTASSERFCAYMSKSALVWIEFLKVEKKEN